MSKGGVFILSGPSGSGKDTILQELFRRCPDLKFSISSITRPMRKGETEGEKYHFISRESFEDMIKNGELLEYNEYVGNYYGTPRKPVEEAVENGNDIFIEVDVNGAANIRKALPEAVSIFVMPPSYGELFRRLSGRGSETPEVIARRMENAVGEIKRATEYDFVVINDDLSCAVDDMIKIISGSSFLLKRKKQFIDEVLCHAES